MLTVLGVDPGIHGALAVLRYPEKKREIIDIPSITVQKSRKTTKIDVYRLIDSLGFLKEAEFRIAYIEDVHSMPKQGVASSFSFGEAKGIIIGVLAALGCAYRLVPPQTWKKHFKLSSDKNEVLSRVRCTYPDLNIRRADQAEALFLLEYGLQSLLRENPTVLLQYGGSDQLSGL